MIDALITLAFLLAITGIFRILLLLVERHTLGGRGRHTGCSLPPQPSRQDLFTDEHPGRNRLGL